MFACPGCAQPVPEGLDHCPACRARGAGATAPKVAPARSDRHERLFLIVACTLAAGVLALPRLRKSAAFGPLGKAVLGTIAVVNTAAAIGVVVFLLWRGPALLTAWVRTLQRTQRGY